MADVRLLIQEEGRAARNLIAFNVPVGTCNSEKVTKKPPSVPRIAQTGSLKRSMKPPTRIRSASTGRDKKSELQARYWAFLFGNLQRAVDGIYQTCEEDENISECKEVILVLENYTRDFHNLIEWFKVKWAYENSPPPLRRTPLAWEVRKTSPCRIWNSTIVPKSTSPLQRMSPTESCCRSPIDQVISENKPIILDNKINHLKEESVHKVIKDSKNTVSKQSSMGIKNKHRNLMDKSGCQSADNEKTSKVINKCLVKHSVAMKNNGNTLMDHKSDMTNRDSKRKLDGKEYANEAKCAMHTVSVSKTDSFLAGSKNEKPSNVKKDSPTSEKENKCVIGSGNLLENQYNTSVRTLTSEKSLELGKNEINAKLKKQNGLKNSTKLITDIAHSENKVTDLKESLLRKSCDNIQVSKISQSTRENSNRICQKNQRLSNNTVSDSPDVKIGTKTPVMNTSSSNSLKVSTISPANRPAYSTVSQIKPIKAQTTSSSETPKFFRSKTTLCDRTVSTTSKIRPGTSVIVRQRPQSFEKKSLEQQSLKKSHSKDINGSVEVLTKQNIPTKLKDDGEGWQIVKSRYRRGSTHSLNMSTRFHKPSTATSLPALSIDSSSEKIKTCFTPDVNQQQRKKCIVGKAGKNITNEVEKVKSESLACCSNKNAREELHAKSTILSDTPSTEMIAAIFKSDAELLEKRIQQFMAAQAERERIILEEERKTEEADSQRSQQLSDEEASLQRQIMELECADIDVDTETDETDGEMVLEMEDESVRPLSAVTEDISLEDRYENMLEGMSWAERVDTLAQLQALVARHPGRALELHQKLSSPSRKRSLPETLRRYQVKQACAQHKRQKLLMEKSQRLRELLNKVEDVKSAKNQLIEDKRIRMEMKLKRAEENRTQHLLEVVRKAHDEDSKLKEIAFINELEAQNKRHDFMALCQEQEDRLQGIHDERQRRQEEKAAKEAAAEERRKAMEAERQLRIQRMRQARREREERVGKMQLEREKERQELAREKARDREERLSALHAAQLANQEELQKKIAQKQQESARRHVENIEHIRQRAVESSILRSEEVPPTLKSYPAQKQCSLCGTIILNEVCLLSHLKGKTHSDAVRNMHDGREPSRDELQRFNITQIRDVPTPVINNNNANDNKASKEKLKALKRRCRKMKQRLALRGQEWENNQKNEVPQTMESSNKTKLRRNLKELDRLCSNHSKSAWSSVATAALERCLGEIGRAFSKSCPLDQDVFRLLNGFGTLTSLLNLGLNTQNAPFILPNKNVVSLCRVYKSSVARNNDNIEAILLSNKVLVIVDLVLQRLEILTNLDDQSQAQEMSNNPVGNCIVATAAMQLLCYLIPEEAVGKPALHTRIQDIVGYFVAGGLVERVYRHSRALVETDSLLDQEHESPLLLASFDLLTRVCNHLKRSPSQDTPASVHHAESNNNNIEQTSTESHLLSSLSSTEAAGAIGALYAAIALSQQNQKGSSPTPNQTVLSAATKTLAVHGLKLFRAIAELDLPKLQDILGAEGSSLQWRLLASYLITRLSRDLLGDKPDLGTPQNTSSTYILTELLTVLGYFAVNNMENQLVLQSAGTRPSVLQQLCTLPFPFYGDPRLTSYTLPTLLAATHGNPEATAILSCELSYQLLEEYKTSEEGKLNSLVRLLKNVNTS